MADTIIKVEKLSKLYRLGEIHKHTGSFRDKVTNSFNRIAQKTKSKILHSMHHSGQTEMGNFSSENPSFIPSSQNDDYLWALKDISFEVKEGEVLGIIGPNGAGKSTLLKILSRITRPTGGKARIMGRVGSLLEVGTGFHPELTGRENIYLNGAILGMRKYELDRKLEEIVAFAEIEKFLNTPVKRYSTGMYVRLAFSVAAHLEPEILLVDEVLAVGDANFQKKCLKKMQDVGQEGRTVLFVSHNMSSITRLCQRTILLNKGVVLKDGPSHQVVSAYLQSGFGTSANREWPEIDKAPGNDIVRLRSVRVIAEDGQTASTIDIRRSVGIEMKYDVLKSGQMLVPNYHCYNENGILVFIVGDSDPDWKRCPRPQGSYVSIAWIPGNLLSECTLIIDAAISTMDPEIVHFHEREVVAFQVIDSMAEDSARGYYAGTVPGIVRPLLKWNTRFQINKTKQV